jgi:tryptophan 2,3-dioxygenase
MAEPGAGTPALTYRTYLALDDLLSAQHPLSAEHDEMLFIVIHQVYELWFKQMIHELSHLRARLEEGDTPRALHTLRRILTILKVAVAQIDVLETMTPRQFTSFRDRLAASSGFQSEQFRLIEVALGRRDDRAFAHFPEDSDSRRRIQEAMSQPTLYESFETYLRLKGYGPDDLQLVYRDEGEPAEVAERLVDLDEGLQEWRYRHVKMVERTIGDKEGTGGSSGAAYLRSTLFHPFFPDLWSVRSEM